MTEPQAVETITVNGQPLDLPAMTDDDLHNATMRALGIVGVTVELHEFEQDGESCAWPFFRFDYRDGPGTVWHPLPDDDSGHDGIVAEVRREMGRLATRVLVAQMREDADDN